MFPPPDLKSYLERLVERSLQAVCEGDLDPSQRELLEATLTRVLSGSRQAPLESPFALPYLILRAWGKTPDEQAEHLGTFCVLYVSALDLFDDVQDEDLTGKPHEAAGPAIAINSALTLLFLALRSLQRAVELEGDAERRHEYYRLFNRVSVLATVGQHRDLSTSTRATTRQEVLELQQAKTSSVALIAECGALLAGCDAQARLAYRQLGEQLTLVVQVVDDLRDIFGKEQSPDLSAGIVTYPVACFLEQATAAQVAEFQHALTELPASLPRLQQLLYETGAVDESASAIEESRAAAHEAIASTGNDSAQHRLLLSVIDGLAEAIYEVEPVPATAHLWQPRGGFHDQVQQARTRCLEHLAPLGIPTPAPRLVPWHQAHYLYQPEKCVIYYPDVEDLAEEVLPLHMALVGSGDPIAAKRCLLEQLPAVLAHELFHFWRDALGLLTEDHWHEEYVANRLSVAYAREYCPEALSSAIELAHDALDRFPRALDEQARDVLDTCKQPGSARGYGMDALENGLVQLEMIRRLSRDDLVLRACVDEHLSSSQRSERVSAA